MVVTLSMGNSSCTKICIANFIILLAFLVRDGILQVNALGHVAPCGPFGSIPWGLVPRIIVVRPFVIYREIVLPP